MGNFMPQLNETSNGGSDNNDKDKREEEAGFNGRSQSGDNKQQRQQQQQRSDLSQSKQYQQNEDQPIEQKKAVNLQRNLITTENIIQPLNQQINTPEKSNSTTYTSPQQAKGNANACNPNSSTSGKCNSNGNGNSNCSNSGNGSGSSNSSVSSNNNQYKSNNNHLKLLNQQIQHQSPDFPMSISKEEKVSRLYEKILRVHLQQQTKGLNSLNLEDIAKDLMNEQLKKPLLNKNNVTDHVIYFVLTSKDSTFFQKPEMKVQYIFMCIQFVVSGELQTNREIQTLISREDQQDLIRSMVQYLITLVLAPISFEIEGLVGEENQHDVYDLKNVFLTQFYQNVAVCDRECFKALFDKLVDNDEYDIILDSIFKRILNDIRTAGSIDNDKPYKAGLDLLEKMFQFEYIAKFFFSKSQYFLGGAGGGGGGNFINMGFGFGIVNNGGGGFGRGGGGCSGLQLQMNTIFGMILSVSTIYDETNIWENYFGKINCQNQHEAQHKMQQLQLKFEEHINKFYNFLLQLSHRSTFIHERILYWMVQVVETNKGMLKTYQHDSPARAGFLYNFTKLMLKFIKPYIENFAVIKENSKLLLVDRIYSTMAFYQNITQISSLTEDTSSQINRHQHHRSASQQLQQNKEQLQQQLQQPQQQTQQQQKATLQSPEQFQVTPHIEMEEEKTPSQSQQQEQQQKQRTPSPQKQQSQLSTKQGQNNTILQQQEYLTQLAAITLATLHITAQLIKQYIRFCEHMGKHKCQHEQKLFHELLGKRFSQEVMLMDSSYMLLLMKFFSLLVSVSLNLNKVYFQDDGNFHVQTIKQQCTAEYCRMPAILIEDLNEYFMFIKNMNPHVLAEQGNRIYFVFNLNFMLIVLGCRSWCSNPYLRARIVYFMSQFVPTEPPNRREPSFQFLFNGICFSHSFFLNALMHVMQDMNRIGLHGNQGGQGHDRFGLVQHFCHILQYILREQKPVSDAMLDYSKNQRESFLEVMNAFMTDFVQIFEQSLLYFTQVKEFETIDNNLFQFNEQYIRQQQYEHIKKNLRWTNGILEELFLLLEQLVLAGGSILKNTMMMEEIREKYVQSINFVMCQLLQNPNLRIKNPTEVKFQTNKYIHILFNIYIAFEKNEQFLRSVAADERYFDLDTFVKDIHTFNKEQCIREDKYNCLIALTERLRCFCTETRLVEEIERTAPEEFLDPLTNEIMKDPVRLPSSGTIMDRVTIRKHLLNDKSDPYNRDPLLEEMLVPLPELKQRIEEYFKGALKALREKKIKKNSYHQLSNADEKVVEATTAPGDHQSQQQQQQHSTQFIPGEFLDAFNGTVMHDPVLLVTSNKIVDRATIVQHLQKDQKDPFNRRELREDMLIPMEELKQKIEKYYTQRSQQQEQLMNSQLEQGSSQCLSDSKQSSSEMDSGNKNQPSTSAEKKEISELHQQQSDVNIKQFNSDLEPFEEEKK